MKRVMSLLTLMLALFIMASCSKVDFDLPEEVVEDQGSSLVLSTRSGFSSSSGTIYVPQDVGTIFNLESKKSKIKHAFWEIEDAKYEGTQVSHKFVSLGEVKVKIRAKFEDGSEEDREFTVISVLDVSSTDPVQIFSEKKSDGSFDVLFLFSKERLRFASSDKYFYNGLVTEWKVKPVPEDNAYIIDKDGKPKKTKDVGKYVGLTINLKLKGLYNIALIHSETNWTDLSGSKFVKADNPGLVWFWFEDGEIIPQGDVETVNLPGESGDEYFRFSYSGASNNDVVLFFQLEKAFQGEAFVVRELSGGGYSAPISLEAVSGHPNWGKIKLAASELEWRVSGFRYGPDKRKLEVYSPNMKKSFFYSDYYKNLRIVVYKI